MEKIACKNNIKNLRYNDNKDSSFVKNEIVNFFINYSVFKPEKQQKRLYNK